MSAEPRPIGSIMGAALLRLVLRQRDAETRAAGIRRMHSAGYLSAEQRDALLADHCQMEGVR